jgi:putative ABC transport system permease protein
MPTQEVLPDTVGSSPASNKHDVTLTMERYLCGDDAVPAKGLWQPFDRWQSKVHLLIAYTWGLLSREYPRFLSAVLAVALSAVLINLEWGLLLGIFSATSIPIDHTSADIWLGAPSVPSVDAGRPISETHLSRLANQPEVGATARYVLAYCSWVRPDSQKENCIAIGSQLVDRAPGTVAELTPELQARLTEPGSVVLDEADCERLGVRQLGDTGEVNGRRVRVVGTVRGLKGLNGPFLFCSLETARDLAALAPDQTTYVLARCRDAGDAPAVVQRLRRHADLSAFTSDEFSLRTRLHWLTKTNGGIATAFTAGLGLLVGLVITRQTLYAATVTSLREYALLRALGIPRRRIAWYVLAQSCGVGGAGVLLAVPLVLGIGGLAGLLGLPMSLPWWLMTAVLAATVLMALLSGLGTLRVLRLMEPISLLR